MMTSNEPSPVPFDHSERKPGRNCARLPISHGREVIESAAGNGLVDVRPHQVLKSIRSALRRPKSRKTVARNVFHLRQLLCLPLIRPIRLRPPAAGVRDGVHRRVATPPPCPASACAHSAARVRLSPAISVSGFLSTYFARIPSRFRSPKGGFRAIGP